MTELSEKKAYVARQGQSRNHKCHWPGCMYEVPPARWGCAAHWFCLPKRIRDAIWFTYEPGQEVDESPSDDYLEAADEAQRWIRENRHD